MKRWLVGQNEKGVILSVALMLLAILTLIGSAAIVSTRSGLKVAANWKANTTVFYAAEAGLEKGIAGLKTLLESTDSPTATQLNAIAAPSLSNPNFSFPEFKVEFVTTASMAMDNGAYQGLRADTTDYRITSEAKGPGGSKTKLVQVVAYQEIPLFQFGVFYGKGVDLEIAPGPPMTFNGRVHANSNLYMRNDSLKFDSFVTTAGKVHRYVKRDLDSNGNPTARGTNPRIMDANGDYQSLNFDHQMKYDFVGEWPDVSQWQSAAQTTFGGKLLDSAMGVREILPPVPSVLNNLDVSQAPDAAHQMIEKGTGSDSDTMKKAKLYYQAELKIVNGSIKDGNGNPVDMTSCDPNAVTNKAFRDAREGKDIAVTEVNIGLLMTCGVTPPHGVMYVSRDGNNQGVRLVNGSQLPSQGLTVVSENPVYIQGDYNTVNKVPAAVMGDSITVLSNNWNDGNAAASTDNRLASHTTVNSAFALGPQAESTAGHGNGQLENVIRFLEDWDGRNFTYRGSIVSLWHSKQGKEEWQCCGQYYRPPNRDWGYDTLFDTNQPPGTPKGVLGLTRKSWAEGDLT